MEVVAVEPAVAVALDVVVAAVLFSVVVAAVEIQAVIVAGTNVD